MLNELVIHGDWHAVEHPPGRVTVFHGFDDKNRLQITFTIKVEG
jgi:hypothetical protein